MTNPKTRKTGKTSIVENADASADDVRELENRRTGEATEEEDDGETCIIPAIMQQVADNNYDDNDNEVDVNDDMSLTPMTSDAADETLTEEQLEEDEEDEDEVDSNSSFSLQECINEFRARRRRRISTQSREANVDDYVRGVVASVPVNGYIDPADADLINQNRSNKEQERKCKPCQNGFCYCFTSDSGEGGGVCAAARGVHVRQTKRNRKSDEYQLPHQQQQQQPKQKQILPMNKEPGRQSAPANLYKSPQKQQLKTKHKQQQQQRPQSPSANLKTKQITYAPLYAPPAPAPQLTAVSRLETTEADAPLIHIIQELHENCVISEVRVNKHKIREQQRSRSLSAKYSPRKVQHERVEPRPISPVEQYIQPSAPPLDEMNELDVAPDGLVYSSPLNSSAKSNDSSRRKHKAAGRLLQKRLGHAHHVQVRPRNLTEPPPKPPRSSLSWEDKSSVSTLASSSASVREAERILDDFLRRKGVRVPEHTPTQAKNELVKAGRRSAKVEKAQEAVKREKRKSYPLTYDDERVVARPTLPSCPSLSDIERVVGSKKSSYYEKNIQAHLPIPEKPVKELSFGWKEPKITEMLNYDTNGNEKQFQTRGVQAEPQELGHIGWQVPPKVDLDTVDGGVRHNLAANIGKKHTPVKSRLFSGYKLKARDSQKFILAEQWRNLSPWSSRNSNNNGNSATKPPRPCSLKSNFLRSSKKKILRLVSPKKENKERLNMQLRQTPLRTVGVQTSQEDLRPYENSSTPQSPPGSYHSAVQTSQQSSSSQTPPQHFDFSRTVQSPPKKAPRAIQRRLNFPLNCSGGVSAKTETDSALTAALKEATLTKTYRSFHSDLDQDVTLSKMGYILGNIRAKLEASDEHAIRTFQEIERREQQSASFDCVDAPPRRPFESRGQRSRRALHESDLHEPIYSEIEEDSIHIKCSPQFDNKTGIQHFSVEHNPEILYAKVQKTPKTPKPRVTTCHSTPPMPLGKFLHDSLKNKSVTPNKPLPPEPVVSSDVSYDSPEAHKTGEHLPHAQSLNNIRVMEHHSPPKCNRHLSKSDLSLQRSEIFLENLCRGEIIVANGELERLQKVDNCELQQSNGDTSFCSSMPDVADADVSYDLPNEESPHVVAADIAPPRTHNQSTPKKQTFLTKPSNEIVSPIQQLSLNLSCIDECPATATTATANNKNTSNSCPNTPSKMLLSSLSSTGERKTHAASLNEMDFYSADNGDDSRRYHSEIVGDILTQTTPTLSRYRRLKDAVRKSLRRSKDYVRNETKRLSTSLNLSSPHSGITNTTTTTTTARSGNDVTDSSYNLDSLFALDDAQAPVQEQLARAVSICRQLPDLEISPEMVEAERLLLYATLQRQHFQLVPKRAPSSAELTRRFYIDGMRLPLRANASQDLFFNYFYICTFECAGHIRSTQSVECHNGEAIFRDCRIEFECHDDAREPSLTCQVFVLRLRKVSTLSLEPRKPQRVQLPGVLTPSPTSSASSTDEIVSRFRLHANFTLNASDFAPYEFVPSASQSVNRICLRASRSCHVPLTHCIKSSNLSSEIVLSGRVEARFAKQQMRGYLNVLQPFSVHNWNRRWCTLDGLQLCVWLDELQMTTEPLLCIDLSLNGQTRPLTASPRELCARPRAFCLQFEVKAAAEDEDVASAAVFFAADTQNELVAWLEQLNVVLDFVAKWLR